MNQLVRSGFGENLRRGGRLVGALGDDPPPTTAPAAAPALPAAGASTATPAPAASPAPAAGPAVASPTTAGGKPKDKDKSAGGPMAAFEALPTVAKVGIGAAAAAVVVGIGAAIVAAVK